MSKNYVRIHSVGDDEPQVHLMLYGMDTALCGHDAVSDDAVHVTDPIPLSGVHAVTCPQCLNAIETVADHLKRTRRK